MIKYYDWSHASATAYYIDVDCTTSSATPGLYFMSSSSTLRRHMIWVAAPKGWSLEDAFAWSEFLASVGIQPDALVQGHVTVMNPTHEIQTFGESLPYVRAWCRGHRSREEGLAKFLEQHPWESD